MDRSVSCWNQFSVQLSFPIVCSSGVSTALSDKSGAFCLGDGPGFSSAVCLSKQQPGMHCVTTQPLWPSWLVVFQGFDSAESLDVGWSPLL